MKLRLILFFILITIASPLADDAHELLVKWRDGPQSLAAAQGNAQVGSQVLRNFNALSWQLISLPSGMSPTEGIKAYEALGTVTAVEPNGTCIIDLPVSEPAIASVQSAVRQSASIPNDPRYALQWHMRKINAPGAWTISTGSSNVIVAIVDSGIDYTHPEIAPNMWRNPGETGLDARGNDKASNGRDDDNNGYVDDVHGANVAEGTGDPMDTGFWFQGNTNNISYHGTFIAGLIGGVGNNNQGIAGLNWSVQMMAVRYFGKHLNDPKHYTPTLQWSRLAQAWDYVVTMKRRGINIRVANISDGNYIESAILRDAIVAAGNEGILIVCSGGNWRYNEDLFSGLPRTINHPSVIAAAASSESDTIVDESSWGANFGRSTIELAAPGINMLSTDKASKYRRNGGSSFAAPLVTGAAALLLSVNPSLTVDQMKAALFGSVDQPSALRGKLVTHGRLNVGRALEYLAKTNPPAIVIYAAPTGQRTPPIAPIQVTFNRPMNRASVESALVTEPAVVGLISWSSDNRSFSLHPSIPFDTTTNYLIRIRGTAEDETNASLDGDFDGVREGSPADDFTWTFRFRIANDDLAAAQRLTGASGTILSSNRYATFQMMEPDHLGDRFSSSSVWYRWTAPESGGWFAFDLTSRTAFDSLLAIYTGDQVEQLIPVAGNDNFGSRQSSRVLFNARPGMEYAVVVAGKSVGMGKILVLPNHAGTFTLTWSPAGPPSFTGSQLSPSKATPGSKLTLFGRNFTGATAVLFNGVPATFTNASSNFVDLQITANVPPDATFGPITVVTPYGNATTTASFQPLPPKLAIRRIAATEVEVTWPAMGEAFVLEVSDNLSSSSWTAVTLPLKTQNGSTTVTIPTLDKTRFFRLRTR